MKNLLAITHGLSSDRAWCDQQMAMISARLGDALGSGWQVRGATLANPDSISGAIASFDDADAPVLVWPHFMTGGWFVREKLPTSLAAAGLDDPCILTPTGLMPDFAGICGTVVQDWLDTDQRQAGNTDLVLIAHGTKRNRDIFRFVETLPEQLQQGFGFRRCVLSFLEQDPVLGDQDYADFDGCCLPLFSLPGGHVEDDIPPGLRQAGFSGALLPPLGITDVVIGRVAGHVKRQFA